MSLNWRWPQYVAIVWLLLGIVIGIGTHGKKDRRDFADSLVSIIIFSGILAFGGFFRIIGWAQIVWTILNVVSLGFIMRSNGQPYTKSVGATLFSFVVNVGLLALGGFFS